MKNFTMITRHGLSKDQITAYTLISQDYQTVTMPVDKLISEMKSGNIAVTNLEISGKGIVSTNGAIDKYTFVNMNTNQVEGIARAVILNRVEQNGNLVGYTVFTQNGTVVGLNTADAAALAKQGLISNGKIKHSASGDVVSSIGGNYPLRSIEINEAPAGEITVNLMYFGTTVGVPVEYFGAIVHCTSATEMSKLIATLSKSNADVISQVVKVAGQSARNSLTIKRMGANGLYGVFDIAILEKLNKRAKFSALGNEMKISAVQYGPDDTTSEAVIDINTSWKAINKSGDMDKAAGELVTKYTKKIMEKFSGIKFQ